MLSCTAEELKSVAFFDEITHPESREADKQLFECLLTEKRKYVQIEKRRETRKTRG
jgi:hypothetical protein